MRFAVLSILCAFIFATVGCAVKISGTEADEKPIKVTKVVTTIAPKDQKVTSLAELLGPNAAQEATTMGGRNCRRVGTECEVIEYCCGASQCQRTCTRTRCWPVIECEPSCSPTQPC